MSYIITEDKKASVSNSIWELAARNNKKPLVVILNKKVLESKSTGE